MRSRHHPTITVQVDHSGEVIVAPMPGFDIEKTIFKTLPAKIDLFGVVPVPSYFRKALEVVRPSLLLTAAFIYSPRASLPLSLSCPLPSFRPAPTRHLTSVSPPSAPHVSPPSAPHAHPYR